MQTTISPAGTLPCQHPQPLAQVRLIGASSSLVADGRRVGVHQATRAPLRQLIRHAQVAHGTALCRGRHQFFAVMSFSARLSKVRSATSCLSLWFSSSNWRQLCSRRS